MAKEKLVEITQREYALLKIYEEDAQSIMKFLAMNHHNIYMEICNKKLRKIEDRVIDLKKRTVVVTLDATGSGAGIVTVRDGAAGTVITQLNGEVLNGKIDLDLDDGLGYPLTAGNALSLECSAAATNEATAIAYAVCAIEI